MNIDWIAQPPYLYRALFPGGLWRISGEKRIVYLTFDDGPHPEVTVKVLDILARYGIKATFFMVGQNVERYPSVVEEIQRSGHSVGNHTMHHAQGLKMRGKEYCSDVAQASKIINSKLFRPPHGLLRPSQIRTLHREGYTLVMYDVVTRDYSEKQTPDMILDRLKRYVRPGSIIVFHDSEKAASRMLETLPKAINWLQSQGYEFAKIPD